LFSRSDAKVVAELRKLRANPNIPRETLLADLVRD
jgi:hypothetical protein